MIDTPGPVRPRNFRHGDDRFIVRLEDIFFDELKAWARSEGLSVGGLVKRLIGSLPSEANRSAHLRAEIAAHLAAGRDDACRERAELERRMGAFIDRLPIPIFQTRSSQIEDYNLAFGAFVQRKLRFPPGLTMKFLARSPTESGTFKGSIILPGHVLPILCERLPALDDDGGLFHAIRV